MWQKIKSRFPAENVIMCHLPLKLKKIIENGTEPKKISLKLSQRQRGYRKAPTSKKEPEQSCWFGKRRHRKAYQQKQNHPCCYPSMYHYNLIIKVIRQDLNKTLEEYATERFNPIARQTSNSRSQAKSPRRTPNNFYRLGVVVQPHRPVASGVEIYIE